MKRGRAAHVIAAIALWACALAMAPTGTSAKSDRLPSPQAVVGNIEQAYGGASLLLSIKSRTFVVSEVEGDQDVTVTTTVDAPSDMLAAYDFATYHVKIDKGFDGKTAWATDSYGNAQQLTADQAQTIRCDAIGSQFGGVVDAAIVASMKVLPYQTFDGKRYIALQVQEPGCAAIVDFVDPDSYLIERAQVGGQTTTFGDFKRGPAGELYPATITATTGQDTVVATVTSLQDNVPVDPSIFSPPASPRSL